MLKIFNKFFDFSGKYKKYFYDSIVMSVFYSIFEAIRIPAIAIVLKDMLENNVTEKTMFLSLGIMIVSIVGCSILKNKITMKQTIGGYELCANKRIDIAQHLKYVPMGYLNDNSLGYITSITTNTLEMLQDVATRVIMLSTQGFINTCIIGICVLIYDYRIGILIFLGILVFLGVNNIMQKKSNKLSPIKTESDSRLVEKILEYIQGISIVKSYNLSHQSNQKVIKAIEDNNDINYKMEKTFIPIMGLQTFVLKSMGILVILTSIYFYLNNSMTLINCILMIICSFIIYGQLESAGNYSALLRVMDNCVDKVNTVFDTPVMDVEGSEIIPKNYDINFDNVSFSYENRKVIDNMLFNIPQNTTTAIVGPSGGGKTTICNLIARFFDVDKGKITLGGNDIRRYKLDSLLKNISMVFQDVYLFQDTVANNIKFGSNNASREDVIKAAKKASCHDFIINLPNGYDTIIGEGGASLSGGEKQRISIARAMLKDAPIIILDEATANVDAENEKQLQDAIEELTRNKTIIMIAHRLKTVRNADQILVVDDGKIVQRGDHHSLIKEEGIYKQFIDVRKEAVGWQL
ncbi:ABC transporter ATP-binding protein/permease [Terrisporobacter petrolearius]|uniref:ABC transporter ATP-binding protein n=1 Tax=Terrisporobacter petrolearius TaxID=1460447 RepID=UPI001D1684A1|nr:ABC transporter ATP-binding protein [Terrisporobacter petrolearius]MCC3864016.1 ABC transporter ATP-binding protein/permease [Terrisporobacter petrolearius]